MTTSKIRAIRDGMITEIDSRLVVPGDIILLEEGEKIPADARLLDTMHFEVNESSLTGESMPVEKKETDDAKNMIYLGTIVARGRATAEVTSTGMNTRFGSIAQKLSEIQKEVTPLEKKLQSIAKIISIIAFAAAATIFCIGIFQNNSIIEMFLTAISLAVAAVPEGLPAVVTITLALGVQRMARRKAILRKLSAIESVGNVTVIATDKTGTLTKNEMHVVRTWFADHVYTARQKIPPANRYTFEKLLKISVICNNASLAPVRDHGSFDVIGDQTEGALLLLAHEHGMEIEATRHAGDIIDEFSFDATTKTMSVLFNDSTGPHVFLKGAPESVLERCSRVITAKGDTALTYKEKSRITAEFESFANEGLRIIACAMKKEPRKTLSRIEAESNLTFVGFVGIADPAREEVKDAIEVARNAGIHTIMITGDNERTAYAIAKNINLVKQGEEIITGSQFESLTDDQIRTKLENVRVFARTTPEQKLRIVTVLQSMGHIVAVTGDGVNDALALKQANVGVAMGKTGTDVAREAAEMVITDDNYATLVSAIEEGRAIYDNMKSAIKYLIGCNFGEILAICGGSLLGLPLILTPLQILYMNLATDGLQAIALAVNPKSQSIMKRKPRTNTHLFTSYDYRWLIEVSVLTATTTVLAFMLGFHYCCLSIGRTLAFTVIILAQQCIYLDIAAGNRSIVRGRLHRTPWIILPFAIIVIQLALIYIPPLQVIFKLSAPDLHLLAITMLVGSSLLVVSELRKRFIRRWYYDHTES
jgi:Ca2+-transporting ATPase